MPVIDACNRRWFNWVHGNNLIYNTCWEDPKLDRIALNIGPNDTVAMITSAGCNALDYALDEPRRIHAVDMNPRQNALLELKIAGIRRLEYDLFFAIFGRGRHPQFETIYRTYLRHELSPAARAFWDRHTYFFTGGGRRNSFYFHGTAGVFAWLVNVYLNRRPNLREGVNALLAAEDVSEQQHIYFGGLREAFWNRFIQWLIGRDFTLSLLGVPQAQRHQVENHYKGGIAQFIEECIDTVFGLLPLDDNYFWRVYLTGAYTETCCPEYLKRENFYRLKEGLVDAIQVHTDTMEGFLAATKEPISRFVLLDHMDWLSAHSRHMLAREWQQILRSAAPGARLIWRSGGLHVDYIDPLLVEVEGRRRRLGNFLSYQPQLAQSLHRQDRVHTYGSFQIADLVVA